MDTIITYFEFRYTQTTEIITCEGYYDQDNLKILIDNIKHISNTDTTITYEIQYNITFKNINFLPVITYTVKK